MLKPLILFVLSSVVTLEAVSILRVLHSDELLETPSEDTLEVEEELPSAPEWTKLCGVYASEDLDLLVERVSEDTGVEAALLAAVMTKESTCRPDAIGDAGEIGLTQVHPRVWTRQLRKQGFIESEGDLFDPETNLRCSAHILGGHLKRSDGNVWQALRRYNGAGPKARKYADRVFATYLQLQD